MSLYLPHPTNAHMCACVHEVSFGLKFVKNYGHIYVINIFKKSGAFEQKAGVLLGVHLTKRRNDPKDELEYIVL